ncbi:non-hydrolyzing UDP-N-acetylglucosamine 2-epimerase [Aquipseudomonas alcaligenes]|uniref:UDP-N-acetylglucosamine 2-epimerase (Non-hydrolyzing) n=1 Tax=Aquipseudomonas alcaligenes TaxID=43263 RepID=A0AB73I333_AQUAC|nr:UDP-N-acetylglucosamine 2-epimerase (non-hydrolyzing) [Pseudomonas alcaligenes]MDH0144627.1 UDP-N-acetylglucosamine 2-epimerase (non-hydrolyzing) [Pseudomonas alcaligenes]
MHLAFVLGTRPEIIKLFSLLGACARQGIPYTLIHTNQHYDAAMDGRFFSEFGLPNAHYNLGVGSDSASQQIGRMLLGIEPVLRDVQPDCVIVQGDTNSALAGGLAASKAGIEVAHVEAGLRSFDKAMPEENNRVLLDHLSSLWFCPSSLQVELLALEGIKGAGVHVTGNTGNDAALQYAPSAIERSSIYRALGLQQEGYLLLTCHRPSNTDDPAYFARLMHAVQGVAEALGRQVIFPQHPRLSRQNREVLREMGHLRAIEPVGYLDMLALMQGAALVLTDSGGMQEEACVLQRRCLILRANTERPESLDTGGACLVPGSERGRLIEAAHALLGARVSWSNPFGDGRAYQRILDVLRARYEAN